jgi:stage II sporulation protein M
MKENTQAGIQKATTVILAYTFLCGMLLGAAAYPALREKTMKLASILKEIIITDSRLQTTLNIFIKNSQASLIMLAVGPTIILPLAAVFANGFIAGLVMHLAYENGKPLWRIILSLLPHGIPELAAIFMAVSAGMNIGLSAVRPDGKPRLKAILESAKKALKTYITRVMPLLLLAAFLETYVSQWIIQ